MNENGRQYCNDTYFMPNDAAEQTRLNIQHQVFLSALDGALTAEPLGDSVFRVFDVGTGPGDWAIAIGEQMPETEVIAVDLGVFEIEGEIPANVTFQLDDLSFDWDFSEPFDFVHVRGLAGAFSDWRRFFREAFKNLVPGGVIEVADADWDAFNRSCEESEAEPTSAFYEWKCKTMQAAQMSGRSLDVSHLDSRVFEEVGFRDVRTTQVSVPVGSVSLHPRMKALGKMWLVCVMEGIEAESLRLLTRELGWTAEAARDLCQRAKDELMKGSHGLVTQFRFVTAKKPVKEE